MGSTHAAQRALFVLGGLRPRRLVSAFGQRIGIDRHAKGGSELEARCDHLGAQGVLTDRKERHAAPVDSPSVHLHGLQFGGDARIENALAHLLGHTGAVIDEEEGANTLLLARRDVYRTGARIAGISQHLDDDVLDLLDIVLGLTSLGLGHAQADEPVAQVLLDAEIPLPRHGGDE